MPTEGPGAVDRGGGGVRVGGLGPGTRNQRKISCIQVVGLRGHLGGGVQDLSSRMTVSQLTGLTSEKAFDQDVNQHR